MGYYVNKIVSWVISPLGVVFILALAAALLHGRWRRWLAVAAVAVLWIASCEFITPLIGATLEGEERPSGAADYPQADAIVLLGGGLDVHEKCGRTELFDGADRAWFAAQLYKAGKAPKIMLGNAGCAQATQPFLEDLGVPAAAMVHFEEARNTEEEAQATQAFLRQASSDIGSGEGRKVRILLVTSAWHMKRASMLFRWADLEVIEAPTDYEMHEVGERGFNVKYFFPSAEALCRNTAALKEWVAYGLYALKGVIKGK